MQPRAEGAQVSKPWRYHHPWRRALKRPTITASPNPQTGAPVLEAPPSGTSLLDKNNVVAGRQPARPRRRLVAQRANDCADPERDPTRDTDQDGEEADERPEHLSG